MTHNRKTRGIAVLLAIAATPLPAAAQEEGPHSDPPAIEAWIVQLESDRYEVREQATRQLVKHGPEALDELAAAADSQRAEAAARAISILEELSDTGDSDLRLAALERLAALANRQVAPFQRASNSGCPATGRPSAK